MGAYPWPSPAHRRRTVRAAGRSGAEPARAHLRRRGPRPSRRSHPLRVRRRAHPPRRAHAGNVDDAGAEVGRCRRPLVSGSWGRLARCRACWARSRRATGARGRPRSLRSRTGAPRSARRRGFQSAPLPPLRSCRAPVGPVRAEPRAMFAPSPSRAAPSAFAVKPRASRGLVASVGPVSIGTSGAPGGSWSWALRASMPPPRCGLLRVTAPLIAAWWGHYVLATSGRDRDPTLV
jgi:hypothetical protein